METILLIFQGLFALYASFLFLGFLGSKNIVLLLSAMVYFVGFACSLYFDSLYPLIASSVSVWVLKTVGFDPSSH